MKFIIIVTLLIMSVLIFLTSCTTVEETAPRRQGGYTQTSKRSSMAEPYYQKNPDGSYYQSTEEGDNADYQADVQRSNSPR